MNEKQEAYKEFSQSYQNYIENQLLFSTLNQILLGAESLDQSLACVVETYMRANYLTSNPDQDSISCSPLDPEAKQILLNKIQDSLDNQMSQLNKFAPFFPTGSMCLLDKIRVCGDTHAKLDAQIDKSANDLSVKSEHCQSIVDECMSLLIAMLRDFKLKLYAERKNPAECEKALLNCELLVAKMFSVYYELFNDVYSSEKRKALAIIRSQIDMDTKKVRESLNKARVDSEMFGAMGNDLDQLLRTYLTLKKELESKNYTLDHLKNSVEY